MGDMLKTCTKCGEEKKLSEFYESSSDMDGRSLWCKSCISKKNTSAQRMKLFGVDERMYDAMLEEQDSLCAICGTHSDECRRSLAVDHDHKTGIIRGLLCTRCNVGLGYFMDNSENLRLAADYLDQFDGGNFIKWTLDE